MCTAMTLRAEARVWQVTCSKNYSSSSTKSYTITIAYRGQAVNPFLTLNFGPLVSCVIPAVQSGGNGIRSIIERQILLSNTLNARPPHDEVRTARAFPPPRLRIR